jgi:excisionase family DNA binding protein
MDEREYLKLDEFQKLCGLSLVTIRRYIKSGKLESVQAAGRGHRILIPRDALDKLRAVPKPPPDPAEGPSRSATLSGPKPRWRVNSQRPNPNPPPGE